MVAFVGSTIRTTPFFVSVTEVSWSAFFTHVARESGVSVPALVFFSTRILAFRAFVPIVTLPPHFIVGAIYIRAAVN